MGMVVLARFAGQVWRSRLSIELKDGLAGGGSLGKGGMAGGGARVRVSDPNVRESNGGVVVRGREVRERGRGGGEGGRETLSLARIQG